MKPHVVRVGAPGTSLRMHVHYVGRQYRDEAAATDAWERVAAARIPDAGASRCKSTEDPQGPGRYVVYLALDEESWQKLAPYATGDPWEPDDGFVNHLIRGRIQAALDGVDSFVKRGPR